MKHRKMKLALAALCAVVAVAVAYVLVSGWIAGLPKLKYAYGVDTGAAVSYPDLDFAVISDLHLYDQSLGSSGSAFDKALHSDRKLLLDSVDLLDCAISEIASSAPQFVLIPGDLTKDGEQLNHAVVADKLHRLSDAGIKVYVVPGNHDVNNPQAVSFDGDKTTPVPSLSAEEFATQYADFGYNDALQRDKDSLSYVAEPAEGLWLLAIDTCRYRYNKAGQEPVLEGSVSQNTADWIARVLTQAADRQKAVVVMMHHGVVEHWDGQRKLHPGYLIDDYRRFGRFLASYNVGLAFTGHYHAQDITRADFGDNFLYDVETGSLVTAPCAIRYCSIADDRFNCRSASIVDTLHPDTDFADKARAFVKSTVMNEALSTLKKFMVPDKDAQYLASAVGDGFIAHYDGDEKPDRRPSFDGSKLGLWSRVVYGTQKYVLDGLWNDLSPTDNVASFPLR